MTDKFLTTSEAAQHVGINVNMLKSLAKNKTIPYLRPSPRTMLFSAADLDRWVESLRARPE